MVDGIASPFDDAQARHTGRWVAGVVGLVTALGGLTGAALAFLVFTSSLHTGFALGVMGYAAALGAGWLMLALWRRADRRWFAGGCVAGGLAALAEGTLPLSIQVGDASAGLARGLWYTAAVALPPLLAALGGLGLAAHFARITRTVVVGALVALLLSLVLNWVFLIALGSVVLTPALLLAPLLLSAPGAPRPGTPRAAGWLRLGYLAQPLALAAGLAVVLLVLE